MESFQYLEDLRDHLSAWDDKAGLCIQLKPDKNLFPYRRLEMRVCFIGFDEFHSARLQITDFVEQHYPREADDILLAFHEAAGNALRHGSDIRPVFVRLRDYAGHVSIRVKDSGRGFDSAEHLRIARDFRQHREKRAGTVGGLGIGIMVTCMDRVYYSILGNEVLLIKKVHTE